ncbi:MAG: hypothetical protein M1825_004997 [Sarcosagium campestre]|nr:MAG: hypothetical protein M1825_004997 [Sarcosagium campestre]
MAAHGWNPDARYMTANGEPPLQAPPPYAAAMAGANGGSLRPDLAFAAGTLPYFGGYQPQPPAPPAPEPPDPPAPILNANVGPYDLPGIRVDGIDPGVNYLYPEKHTTLHVIHGGIAPYDVAGLLFHFTILRVPCNITVAELIHQLGARGGGDEQNGVTECLEIGGGRWVKGISVFKSDEMANQTLGQLGWDDSRGHGPLPPVWIAVSRG